MDMWVDFVRDLLGAPEKAAMQAHLDTGCKKCSEAKALWERVYSIAQSESALEPPEAVVRSIKGAFAIHGPKPTGVRAVAKLLFDSALSPVQAGVRSSAPAARQLLFGVGEYSIDLRMEPQVDSDRVALVGQVLRSNDSADGLGELAVALVKKHKVVAETTTSRFGEFNMECELEGAFQLRIKSSAKELELPLIEPTRLQSLSSDSKGVSKRVKPYKKRTKGTH